MRAIAVVGLALLMAGCSNKSVVQKWANSEPAMASHSGPVCFLPTELPDGVESTFLGRAVANQQWYGGYAGVNAALANVARSVGADVIAEKRQKMKFGFFAWARPQVWGWAHRLDDPAAIDCVALGGTIDPGNGVPLAVRRPGAAAVAPYGGTKASDYTLDPAALAAAHAEIKAPPAEAPVPLADRLSPSFAVLTGYSEKQDRFSGVKTYSWNAGPNYRPLSPALFMNAGPDGVKDGLVVLSGTFREWEYLRCSQTYWLADGERVLALSQDHDGTTGGAGVIEHVSSLFGVAELRKIAAAKSLEYKVCNDEFRLTADQLAGFKLAISKALR